MEVRDQEHQRAPAPDHRQRFQQTLRPGPARRERLQAGREVDPGAGHPRRRQHELVAHVAVAADERERIPGATGGVPQRRDEAGQDFESIPSAPPPERGGQVGEDTDPSRRSLAVSPHQQPPERIPQARQQVQAARVPAVQQRPVQHRLQAASGLRARMHARVDGAYPAVEAIANLDRGGRGPRRNRRPERLPGFGHGDATVSRILATSCPAISDRRIS